MALNNLGMGLVYTVKDQATAVLAKISAGIQSVSQEAARAAATTPKDLTAIGTGLTKVTREAARIGETAPRSLDTVRKSLTAVSREAATTADRTSRSMNAMGATTGRAFTGGATAMRSFGSQLTTVTSQVGGLAARAESGFQRLAAAVRSPVERLMNLKNVLTGVATAWGGMKVIEAAGYEEQARMALGVMLKDQAAGDAVFNKARKFGDVTPFDTQQVIGATRMAVSSKFQLNDIFQGGLLQDMGNLAAANSDMGIDISEVARVFSRLKSGDFGEAFERLRDMQIGFPDLQQAGLKVKAGASFSGLDPDAVIKAVRSIIQDRFGGMMDKMQYSWQGVWSTFTSNITNTFASIGQAKIPGTSISVLDAVKNRVITLTSALVDNEGKLTPGMQRFVTLAASGFGLVGKGFDFLVKVMGRARLLFSVMWDAMKRAPLPDVAAGLRTIGNFLTRLIAPLNNRTLWYEAGMLLREAFAAAQPVIAKIWRIVEGFTPIVTGVVGALWNFAAPLAVMGGYVIWTVLKDTVDVLEDFATWLNSGTTAADFAKAALIGLGTAILLYQGYLKAVALYQTLAAATTTAWTTALAFLNTMFIASPIGWIVLSIAALIAVVYLAYTYWDVWTAALQRFGNWVWGGLMGAFHAITGWFAGLPVWIQWAIVAFAPFIGLPLMIITHWDAIKKWFTELPAQAREWGSNFMRMFADGIAAQIEYVKGKVAGVAKGLKDFLGFSSPTRLGPGHTANRWAPNLMAMYTEGIDEGIPNLQAASGRAANALSATLTPTITPGGTPAPAGATAPGRAAQDAPQLASAAQTITVIAKLILADGRELAEVIIPVLREEAALGFGRG